MDAHQGAVITQPLLHILALTGVHHSSTLDSIVAETQKKWLRPRDQERWHMVSPYESLRDKLQPLFDQMGLLSEVRPQYNEYEYALLNGDTLKYFRPRIAFLFLLFEEGVRFQKLIVCTGARPLDPDEEPETMFFDRDNGIAPIRDDYQLPAELPKTETDIAHMLFDQAIFPVWFTESVAIEFVDTPMQKHTDGSVRRPNTGDTIHHWLDRYPKPGSVLSISDQPFVCYQHAVLKTLLPPPFVVETVGPAADKPITVGIFLDNLARWLYQELQLRKA